MAQAIISRKGGSGGEATITFDNAKSNVFFSNSNAELSELKTSIVATTVGDYALFGGGSKGSLSECYDIVNAFQIKSKVFVYPGTKYKFGSMASEETSATMQELTFTPPITGYIKIKDATIN